MDIWVMLLIVSLSWIVGHWLYIVWIPKEEGFQTWSLSALDKKAREGHVCQSKNSFPDEEISGATVEIVDDSCEAGLPHTSDANTIRIPAAMWGSPERRASALRHERVHLLQRRDPAAWAKFYRTAWQYTLSDKEPVGLPAEVLDTVRGNPDTEGDRWATWGGRYVWVPTYTDVNAPSLPAATTRVWDSVKQGWVTEPPAAWRSAFCLENGDCPYQSEHPHEIAAEMWTDIDRWSLTPAGFQLRHFLENLPGK